MAPPPPAHTLCPLQDPQVIYVLPHPAQRGQMRFHSVSSRSGAFAFAPLSPWEPPLASEAVSLQMAVVTKDSPGRPSSQSVRGLMP